MDPTFEHLGLAALLGLLVGLQREHAAAGLAGMRTFPLITILGTVAAMLAQHFGGWILAAGFLGIAALIAVRSPRVRQANTHPGTTTDVTMLLMYGVGALLVVGPTPAAVAVGGAAAVLLQFKGELHGFAERLGNEDLRAIMQFVLLTCIILPVLPQQTLRLLPDPPYGPLNVFNPFEIWLMVVLIVGLSLGGYILYKFAGEGAGILFGGILGGAVSSTATTVTYSRRARGNPPAARTAAIVIMIATAVSFFRVLVEVAVVSSPEFALTVAGPALALMLLSLVPSVALWLCHRHQPGPVPGPKNPTELRSALVFGVMYAAVLFGLAVAKYFFHTGGLYAVAGIGGLTEVDSVTLSTARLAMTDATIAADGWRLIVVAAMANMVSKAALAGILG
ncbi:MAG: MgtC/SapB family protein, partial [Thermoguttaceae bacterium]